MLHGDVKRDKIGTHQVSEVIEKRGKPEVHLHLGITFVWGGDPMAILPEDRNQKEIELKQFAARTRYGMLKQVDIERLMKEFEYMVTETLRPTGALKGGQ